MPTVLRWNGYRFYFYSGDRHEPVHIHICKGNAEAKFWLEPVSLAIAYNFADNELGKIEKKVIEHQKDLIDAWFKYFG